MNKINAIYVSLLALIISVACAAVCMTKCNKAAPVAETAAPAAAPVVSADVETIRTVLNNNPEIVFDAMQRYQIQQEEARQKAAAEKPKAAVPRKSVHISQKESRQTQFLMAMFSILSSFPTKAYENGCHS